MILIEQIKETKQILDILLKVRGNKIITLSDMESSEFVIDIHRNGKIGYETSHKLLLLEKLSKLLDVGGAILIRRFLDLKIERIVNNKKLWIPQKKIYGLFIRERKCYSLNKEELKIAYNIDAGTGRLIKPEKDVIFSSILEEIS